MTRREAIKLLKSQTEVIALDGASYVMLLSLGLELAYRGAHPLAKIVKGF